MTGRPKSITKKSENTLPVSTVIAGSNTPKRRRAGSGGQDGSNSIEETTGSVVLEQAPDDRRRKRRAEDQVALVDTGEAAPEKAGGDGGTSSLTKMLSIMDLFSSESPIWSTIEIIEKLETSRSTGYRYIKALNEAGLLTAVGNGYYILGPRIIELDLQIRNTDPLLQAGSGILERLVEATGHSAILSTLFRNSVLCIREHLAPLSPENMFSRGQRRPLLKGAISKIILANLPNHRLRSMFARNQAGIMDAGLGRTWEEFRDALAKIRKDGVAITQGEFNPGVVGIAAPIFNSEHAILGSIGIAMSAEEVKDTDMNKAVVSVKRAAREVSLRMATAVSGLGLPPRAVG